ncbi:MAG TPA: acetamidase/formamidase family protein [Xanthobacteraceae bacterium]|nr:acetamidase/formamidase family protein [Xanthobacteraceae bacterium]
MSQPTRSFALIGAAALAIAALASSGAAQPAPAASKPDAIKADVTLGSTPGTVVWGYFAARIKPVLRIKSGTTVRIDTLSHQGVLTKDDPVTFFAAGGVRADEVLQDAKDIYTKVPHPGGLGAHVLTGPIYIEGAEPGDMLEVRVRDLELRVPYGVNNTGPGSGVLPDLVTKPAPLIIRTDAARKVALLPGGIELPLSPFLGIMAVAPPPDLIAVNSVPPGRWGGNLDLRVLTVGATLYLPVFADGALFYTGDPHGLQADGEVDGTALEQSLTATLQFILHKGAGHAMRGPRAEDAANYYALGLDLDLNTAMKKSVQETVELLQQKGHLTAAEAYAVASMGVDFKVAEAVDSVQVIYGTIPKRLFKQNPPYWEK